MYFDSATQLAAEKAVAASCRAREIRWKLYLSTPHPPPFCTDDYGSSVYRCHWTGQIVWAEQAVITGGYMPNAKRKFIAAPGYEAARKCEYQAFADNDRNCNTCRNLERIKQPRDPFGSQRGRCKLIIPPESDLIKFYPDDPMHMSCYESRFE